MKSLILLALIGIYSINSNAQSINDKIFASNFSIKEGVEKKTELEQLNSVLNSNINYGPRPGDALIKFSRMYYGGLGVMGFGYGIMIASVINGNDGLILLGALTSTAGLIAMIASYHHIAKAGRMMNQLDDQYRRELEDRKKSSFKFNSSNDGLGLAYNF